MLAPWKKSYNKPIQRIKKQRHYFADKGPYSQSYGFSSSHGWMWEFSLWKTDCRRIEAFELWCWRRLLRVPWASRRSNQSILKKISPEYSLEGLMLKLKLQYLGHLKRPWCWERLKAGGEESGRGWDWLDSRSDSTNMNLSKLWESEGQGRLACCSPWGCKKSDMTEWLNTTTTTLNSYNVVYVDYTSI